MAKTASPYRVPEPHFAHPDVEPSAAPQTESYAGPPEDRFSGASRRNVHWPWHISWSMSRSASQASIAPITLSRQAGFEP
ncbi:hypothetical protein [Streptomyces sp. NPDC059816]|uniref:hypothetical protein n=1 Tax=Streptomyces sp. NPDC059816 TaxID=3346960 RepID=UPI00366272CA